MARTYTVLQFADRMEKLAKNLNKAILPPFRKNLKLMQRALAAEYWKQPFAARIWKWQRDVKGDPHGAPSIKLGTPKRRRYARWSPSEKAYIGKIWVFGLAAKMEIGGLRLRKHAFWGRKDKRDPGLPVPRRPQWDRVVENRLWPNTVDDISDDFWKFVEREL
jgi:hypothetical protein